MLPCRAISLALLLASCSPLPDRETAYFTNLPLDANGLPPHFTRCVSNTVEKKTQVYDVFYLCRGELITYVVQTPGLDPTGKADLLAEYEKRGMSYAHNAAMSRWGDKALPPLSTVKAAPPPAAKPAPAPSEPIIVWGPPMPAPPSEGLRF